MTYCSQECAVLERHNLDENPPMCAHCRGEFATAWEKKQQRKVEILELRKQRDELTAEVTRLKFQCALVSNELTDWMTKVLGIPFGVDAKSFIPERCLTKFVADVRNERWKAWEAHFTGLQKRRKEAQEYQVDYDGIEALFC